MFTLLQLFLHLIFHLNLFYLIRPKPFPISQSTKPINSTLPNNNNHKNKQTNNNNNLSAILITTNHSEFSLHLALQFAAIGYHVFIQVSSHSQLTQVIIQWQHLKSTLNNKPNSNSQHKSSNTRGIIIPLLYLTHHLTQRLQAISTISAYIQQNNIDMITLINIIDPLRIHKSYPSFYSPTSPTFSLPPRPNQPPLSACSSPSFSTRPLTGITSPSTSSEQLTNIHSPSTPRSFPAALPNTSQHHELYNREPLPLSISSENYVFDAFGDVLLGPLSTIQDLLLLFKDHRGRVINIWDGLRYSQSGLNKVLSEAFQKTNNVLRTELEPLQIPVSTIYKPPGNIANFQSRSARSILTRDPRSLLTEASDPYLLNLFTKQIEKVITKENSNLEAHSDPNKWPSFDLVRSVLETNYPCPVYPIGIREVIGQFSQLSGLDRLCSRIERLVEI